MKKKITVSYLKRIIKEELQNLTEELKKYTPDELDTLSSSIERSASRAGLENIKLQSYNAIYKIPGGKMDVPLSTFELPDEYQQQISGKHVPIKKLVYKLEPHIYGHTMEGFNYAPENIGELKFSFGMKNADAIVGQGMYYDAPHKEKGLVTKEQGSAMRAASGFITITGADFMSGEAGAKMKAHVDKHLSKIIPAFEKAAPEAAPEAAQEKPKGMMGRFRSAIGLEESKKITTSYLKRIVKEELKRLK